MTLLFASSTDWQCGGSSLNRTTFQVVILSSSTSQTPQGFRYIWRSTGLILWMRNTTFTVPHHFFHCGLRFSLFWRNLVSLDLLGSCYFGPVFHRGYDTVCCYVCQFSTFCTWACTLMAEMAYFTPFPGFWLSGLWNHFPFRDSTEWTFTNQMWALTVWTDAQGRFMLLLTIFA